VKALSLQPNNPRIFVLKGEIDIALGDRQAASQALRRALDLQPGQKEVEDLLQKVESGKL